jgi:hypothetical protein
MGSNGRTLRRRGPKGQRSLLSRVTARTCLLSAGLLIVWGFLQRSVRTRLWPSSGESWHNEPSLASNTMDKGSLSHSKDAKKPLDYSAACLLVMDDNHFLVEWLAYHYHTILLRRLVVALDPRSKTSPAKIFDRWKNSPLNITVWWNDSDYVSNASEWEQAESWVAQRFAQDKPSVDLIRHRARQRLFYYHCMREHKRNGMEYTLLTDVDEFITINYESMRNLRPTDAPWPIAQAGSVLQLLQHEREFHPTDNITSLPCVQIPRLRFGAVETNLHSDPSLLRISDTSMNSWDVSRLATLRWRMHADVGNYPLNRISKVVVDLSRVEWQYLMPVASIHRPIEHYCKKRKLHIRAPEQLFVVHHYLGTWEQFSYREDSRAGNERSRKVSSFIICETSAMSSFVALSDSVLHPRHSSQMYDRAASVNASVRNEIIPWLEGFVTDVGSTRAKYLLKDAGVVHPQDPEA